jgi:hypothetical protein
VDGEEVLNQENTSLELNTVLNTMNNDFKHECLDEPVRLLNAHPVPQSTNDCVPGHKYSIAGLPGIEFLAHQVSAIWFIVRRWVWDADMPGALVEDEIGLGKTFTLVAAAMPCKLVSENVVMGLPLSIVWENPVKEWDDEAQNNIPGIIREEREWCSFRRQNLVPCSISQIQSTPPQEPPTLTSASRPILVVTMPGVAKTFICVIDNMTYGTYFTLINMLYAEKANLTHEDLNTRIDKPENRWNIHIVLSDT